MRKKPQKQSFANIHHILENFTNFAEKTPVLESLLNKVADLKTCNFIKRRLQHRCFPVKFAKFLRTSPVATFETKHMHDSNICCRFIKY